MPKKPTKSPHLRVRQDHATETAEDYVEFIAEMQGEHGACRVMDLAERFHVSHVTVIQTLRRLERDGLVRTEPRRPIQLTDKGRRLARVCRERHETVYRFLVAIGVREETAAVDTEGIEHHVSPETLERFRAFLDDPDG